MFKESPATSVLRFEILHGSSPEAKPVLEHIIHKLFPSYGKNIFSFVKKIKDAKDRTCELLYSDDELIGLIVYKNHLSSEYAEFGIVDAFELKTLLLFDPETHARKGFGKILLRRTAEAALEMGTHTIFGTVSESSTVAFQFLTKNGFEVANIFQGKYVDGLDEYLVCNRNIDRLVI